MSTLTTFEAHGHTWQVHTPGDPMPCKPDTLIFTLFKCEFEKGIIEVPASNPDKWKWQEIDDDYSIIGWRYAAPPQEKDELTRLREENARMRTAIKDGHAALEKVYLAYCSTTADVENCGIDNIARDALATLSPFTESK